MLSFIILFGIFLICTLTTYTIGYQIGKKISDDIKEFIIDVSLYDK